MKTILIAHNYSDKSFAAMSKALANHLTTRNYRVIFISHSPIFNPPITDNNGVKVYSWPEPRPTGIKSLKLSLQLFSKYKPDIVIAHFGAINWMMLVSFLYRSKKRMAYYHTLSKQVAIDQKANLKMALNRFRRQLTYYFCTTEIICVSAFAKEDFIEYYCPKSFLRPKLTICHNGLPDRYQEYNAINFDQKIRINYLGRVDKSKGILEIINFINKTPELKTRISLTIAGKGDLSEKIENLQNDSITYIGQLSYNEVDNYIKSAHFTIVPSHMDNLPTVGLESLMVGVPVIGNQRGGIPEIVADNYNGFIFDGHSDGELTTLFNKVLSVTPEQYQLFKANARESYLRKFSLNTYIHNMMDIIEK